ncbi:MAG: ABATE domain-containing protein [Thermomicrobiales bacterium]
MTTHDHDFDLDAGILALDFANTLDGRYDPVPRELLRGYDDVLAFSLLAKTLDQSAADRLAELASRSPDAAELQLRDARELRESIFGVFSAVAGGDEPQDVDLDALNRFQAKAMSRGKLVHAADGFGWGWEDDDALDRPLWPLVRSAVDLLLTGDRRRLRECAAADCGWLFYDTSRNQSRRWCSMQSCGNRAKVQQFRERRRDGRGER